MNLENIIMIGFCVAAVAAVFWVLWNKLSAQQQETSSVKKRLEAIESVFALPPPPDDLNSMLGSKQQPTSLLSHNQPYKLERSWSKRPTEAFVDQSHQESKDWFVKPSTSTGLWSTTNKTSGENTSRTVRDTFLREPEENKNAFITTTSKTTSVSPSTSTESKVVVLSSSCNVNGVNGLCGIEPLSVEEPFLSKPEQLDLIADEMLEIINDTDRTDRRV